MATLHVFFDKGGFFSKITIDFIEEIAPKTHYYYFENISDKKENINTIHTEDQIINLIENKEINKIVFHSFHTFQFRLFNKLKSYKVKTAWVFWSFEYYQLPFNLSKLYSPQNVLFKIRKYASLVVENISLFLKGRINSPFFISKKEYFNIINQVDEFYSFVEEDYLTIYPNSHKVKYSFLSYLNIENLNQDSNSKKDENIIMVGHSGSPLLNHKDVLDTLKSIKEKSQILIPITNGNKKYIQKLKSNVANDKLLNIQFLENRLPLNEYYSLLSSVSVFFINSYCQLGLGNIVFFLKNGTTIYLSEKSSTYNFLKRKGFHVYSVESLKNSSKISRLTNEESMNNQIKIEQLISTENVKNQWKKLIEE